MVDSSHINCDEDGDVMKRKYYIDNIRWIFILVLIPFHAAMAWNGWEGNYIWFEPCKPLSAFVIFVDPPYMATLFVLAGMSIKFSLKKRSSKQFLMERVHKLLVPLLIGIATVVAVMTYYADRFHNGYCGSFLSHYKVFFTHISDFTGYDGYFTPGHLWFMLFLFLVSCLVLGVIGLQKRFLLDLSFENCKLIGVILIGVVPEIFAPVLDFGGKSIGRSFALVLLGYYIFSEETVIHRMEKYAGIFLGITAVSSSCLVILFVFLENQTSVWNTIFCDISQWFGILGVIGFAGKHMNWNNKVTQYLSKNSFRIYIVHFMWIVISQYYLSQVVSEIYLLYALSVISALLLTLFTVEVIGWIEKMIKRDRK